MEIIWNINSIIDDTDGVLTLGTFDGVHLGHQRIIAEVKSRAKNRSAKSTLIIFEPHPQFVLQRENLSPIEILTTIEEKIRVLEKTDLDRLVVANFSLSLAGLSPEDFVKSILLDKLHMKEIIIGHDHAFGRNREGNIELLQKMSREFSFDVSALSPVTINDIIVSSTKIRNLLKDGMLAEAHEFLGRSYSILAQVAEGDGRGRKLGYPTVNLRPYSQHKLIPKLGIYATILHVDNTPYQSVTYVGERPTFGMKNVVVETHIVNFDRDIYGKEVELEFFHFIRSDERFDNQDGLVKQIELDLQTSMELFKNGKS